MRLLSLSEVSIQKRTSPDKFTGKLGIRDFEISFAFSLVLAFELTGQRSLLGSGAGGLLLSFVHLCGNRCDGAADTGFHLRLHLQGHLAMPSGCSIFKLSPGAPLLHL